MIVSNGGRFWQTQVAVGVFQADLELLDCPHIDLGSSKQRLYPFPRRTLHRVNWASTAA